ncbi:hypothetical protein [Catenulispora pinisilvae]|nr:hypothetical protein [Catenulispora pinisilvae]
MPFATLPVTVEDGDGLDVVPVGVGDDDGGADEADKEVVGVGVDVVADV